MRASGQDRPGEKCDDSESCLWDDDGLQIAESEQPQGVCMIPERSMVFDSINEEYRRL